MKINYDVVKSILIHEIEQTKLIPQDDFSEGMLAAYKKLLFIITHKTIEFDLEKYDLVEYLLEKQKQLRFTQREMAEYLEITIQALNYVLSRKRIAGSKINMMVARRFGLSVSDVKKMADRVVLRDGI